MKEKKIHLFYFSGTGNTWWTAKRISEELSLAGNSVGLSSIEQVTENEVKDIIDSSDMIGIGYPIYGSDLPETMKWFIDEVLPSNDQPKTELFVFCTQLIYSGDGAYVYRKELRSKGWEISSGVHIHMPNNISVTVFPIKSTNDQAKIDRKLRRASKKIHRFCARLLSSSPRRQGHTFGSFLLGIMQRGFYRLEYKHLQDDVSIDHEKCTGCMRCVRICSAGNLIEEDGKVIPQGKCILCLRCYNYCPVQAVMYMKKPHKEKYGIPYRGPVAEFKPEMICRESKKNQIN